MSCTVHGQKHIGGVANGQNFWTVYFPEREWMVTRTSGCHELSTMLAEDLSCHLVQFLPQQKLPLWAIRAEWTQILLFLQDSQTVLLQLAASASPGNLIKMQSIPMFPTATTFNSAVNWLLSRSAAHFSFQGNLVIFYFIVWGLKSFLDSSFLVSLSYLPKNVLGKRKWKVNLFLSLPTWNTLAYQKRKKKFDSTATLVLLYGYQILGRTSSCLKDLKAVFEFFPKHTLLLCEI